MRIGDSLYILRRDAEAIKLNRSSVPLDIHRILRRDAEAIKLNRSSVPLDIRRDAEYIIKRGNGGVILPIGISFFTKKGYISSKIGRVFQNSVRERLFLEGHNQLSAGHRHITEGQDHIIAGQCRNTVGHRQNTVGRWHNTVGHNRHFSRRNRE